MRPSKRVLIPIGIAALLAIGLTAGFSIGRSNTKSTVPQQGAATPKDPAPTASSPTASDPSSKSDDHHKHHGKSASFASTSAAPPQVPAVAGLPALRCPNATVTVHNNAGLQAALNAARPGTVIHLNNGIYYGRFQGKGAGTQSKPIWVCGGRQAILDDSQQNQGPAPPEGSGAYGFHLTGASWWNLVGFSVRNAQKGVMLDHSTHSTVYGLTVYNIGDEAIHLREFSSDNLVEGCVVRTTGLRVAKYGEGVYLGTADSNWATYTGGKPDTSNDNKVLYNNIANTTAENIDVKEGTMGGELAFNQLDGNSMVESAATSWVNVKGNDYSVHGNTGRISLDNGFSTHKIVEGSGSGNVFSDNHVGAGVVGYGFDFDSHGNTLLCNNTGQGQKGQANVSCTS
jgi:hypothetical protein